MLSESIDSCHVDHESMSMFLFDLGLDSNHEFDLAKSCSSNILICVLILFISLIWRGLVREIS